MHYKIDNNFIVNVHLEFCRQRNDENQIFILLNEIFETNARMQDEKIISIKLQWHLGMTNMTSNITVLYLSIFFQLKNKNYLKL